MSEYDPKIVEKLALASLNENKARRRWNNFFRLAWLLIAAFVIYQVWIAKPTNPSAGGSGATGPITAHTAVIQLKGVIENDGAVDAGRVNASLRNAFESSGSKAVILYLDSPGGSPVQSGQIYKEIKRLRAIYKDKPIYAVVQDICASGCYYVASATDKIYADQASLVGSIGVLLDGFGVTGLMEKVGVERRLYTAGENKGMLDPFSPQNEKHKAHLNSMLQEVHRQFIQAVKEGRGAALKDNPDIFSGLVWSGNEAVKLGLVDDLKSTRDVARDVVKAEELFDYTEQENFVDRLSKRLGASFGAGFGSAAASALFKTMSTGQIK